MSMVVGRPGPFFEGGCVALPVVSGDLPLPLFPAAVNTNPISESDDPDVDAGGPAIARIAAVSATIFTRLVCISFKLG